MLNRLFGIGNRETIGSILARHRGIGPGFDLLRIILALYIFYGHALWIAGGTTSVAGVVSLTPGAGAEIKNAISATTAIPSDGFSGWTRPFHVAAVPVFFALSGFLVVGSAIRLRATTTFLAYRFLRIFPALVVETGLCAFFLGASLTTLTTSQYYSDPLFFRYLGNMAGVISFHLPDVFLSNPVVGIVNANLWTLPSEFDCYFLTAILMVSGIVYKRLIFTALYVVASLALIISGAIWGYGITSGILSPAAIVLYFFTGILVYHWADRIRADVYMFLGSSMVSYIMLMFKETAFLAPIPVTYSMAFVGMIAIPKLPLISRGDYSYGIYLYGFPISQGLVAAFPNVFVGHRYLLLMVAAAVTCGFAAFSWHVIEIRALTLKRKLSSRWFPVPLRTVRQTPESRSDQAGVAVEA